MLLSELIGRNVLCTDTGETVGRISRLLLGERGRRIAYYALQDSWYLPPRVIAGEHLRIHSVAVVPSEAHVRSIIDVPEAVKLANRTVTIGAPVYTRGGDFAGRVEDWSFTEGGALESLRINGFDIPLEDICVVGRDAVIIASNALLPDYDRPLRTEGLGAEETTDKAQERTPKASPPDEGFAAPPESANASGGQNMPIDAPVASAPLTDAPEKITGAIPVPPRAELRSAVSEVGERAAEFLCGQYATADIALPDGQWLIRCGALITAEVITAAKAFDKLVELTIKASAIAPSPDVEGIAQGEEVE